MAIHTRPLIRKNRKKILQLAIKKSKATVPFLSKENILPVKYIRLFIYDTNKRVRQLRYSGLIEELICTIEVNTTKRIKTIDISGGTAEQIGKYRIVWNKKWLENRAAGNRNQAKSL